MSSDRDFSKDDFLRVTNACEQLVGYRCWNITRGYGGSYNFDFGKAIQFESNTIGEVFIRTHGTQFAVFNSSGFLLDKDISISDEPADIDKIKTILSVLINNEVLQVTVDQDTLNIQISFSSLNTLKIMPSKDDDEFDEPYWSITFVENYTLFIGPHKSYRFQKGDSGNIPT